jgi:hypothetical protein
MDEDQLNAYFLPLFSLAIVLIVVGVVVLFLEPRVGIWFFLGGLLILAFLWYSSNISGPRSVAIAHEASMAEGTALETAIETATAEANTVRKTSAARESRGLTDHHAKGRWEDDNRRARVAAGLLKLNAKREAKRLASLTAS